MSEHVSAPTQAPDTRSVAILLTLGGIAMLSGLLIVLVYEITKPMIEANRQALIERAIFQVVPGASQRMDIVIEGDGRRATVYAAYDEQGDLRGVAAEGMAQGYQDVIRLLYGYNPDCECITGVRILQLSETPGLGDKIITDQRFQQNFEALDVRLDAAASALANPITVVRQGSKEQPWQIDGISGATISVEAVARALRESSEWLLPKLLPRMEEIKALNTEGTENTEENP